MIQKQIKDLAWNTFKQTGDINTFMELLQVENMQNNGLVGPQENAQGIEKQIKE